ncbi:type VI secretion system baseplate subunit TssE [Pseudomonas hefeiensis]|uniref:Type VI secretion system baseplate subunit TssE n=1 Tax=Pseudomonas hefeiensis TaxID=2738125 RepID=A0ABY9GBR6_9PSED|nr:MULTISPECIES: type VI secretion system baseplate subunit TssE [unclassified Pseudomonas]WLH12946.1 type VI secretion system baseplate subunit TssE [Pseudomonas sp. FP205]WLH96012.1 type VI secretion system baseplate subunit TssE [Pseudomonas sp. FP53]WLI40283.1 type VI secretion system baseplate subunit TssE [Pseudomonas sp. FP821]
MTGYGSLFERLNGDVDKRTGLSRDVCAMASVAAHLAKMLSTRSGSVQTSAHYGVPDLNDMRFSLHDARSQAREAIKTLIETYEPRLSNVCVASVPGNTGQLRLFFSIDALLVMEGFKQQVSFTASLDGRGQIKVSQG